MAINYEKHGDHVAVITLNRPEALNAFDASLRREFLDAVCEASGTAEIRAAIITGEGRGFCAGADIRDIDEGRNVEDILNAEYGAFLSVIRGGETPFIAAINGPAAGIGMTTALSCDLRVIAENAYLMSAFAEIGLVPDGGLSWILTQQVGYSRAYQMAIDAEKIGAAKCLDLGLVNRVAPVDELMSNALAWAEDIAQRAPKAMGLTKRAFRAAAESGVTNAAAYEALLQRSAILTEDCREGVMAKLQKRPANFKGR